VIKADIPGVPKDALKVTVDNGVLTLQGERHQVPSQPFRFFTFPRRPTSWP
jgi:HSP20 family molecular chaperone IbpA